MYIEEAIRRADALSPNEYTLQEKYAWCDELGAMLMQEHLKKYKKVTLEPATDGTYLLPEGITYEMIELILAQGREIEKYDFRSFGIRPLYLPRERLFVPEHCQRSGAIEVVYLAQYEPIRTIKMENVKLRSEASWSPKFLALVFTEPDIEFRVGDTLKLSGYIIPGRPAYEDTFGVRSIEEFVDSGNTYYYVYLDALIDNFNGESRVTAERIVTDETLVPAPYDQMYVDFIMSKIAYYQRNYTVYNQLMNVFNQRMQKFDNWRISRDVRVKDNKIRNWW